MWKILCTLGFHWKIKTSHGFRCKKCGKFVKG